MAHRKSGLSMAAMVTEIGLSAARVGQLIKRAEVATLSRTACFFRVVAAGEYHRLRISLTGAQVQAVPRIWPGGPMRATGWRKTPIWPSVI